ncbi:MAG: SIS domain-containing protein [Planctomycetota bacterium]|jgi:glucosamine--fructose-6-phosphate aminotransferase (isomerizing)
MTDGSILFANDCALTSNALRSWQPWPALNQALTDGVVLVGEGSSRLLPGAFARSLLRRWGLPLAFDVCGGRAADDLAPGRRVLWSSNSGATRELVEALNARASASGDLGLFGLSGGPLPSALAEQRSLLPRPEDAVAATASVFLQAFTIAAALAELAGARVPHRELADTVDAILAAELPAEWLATATAAQRWYWADGETGSGDELALKTMELLGLPGISAPGTMLLHGVEEVLGPDDVLVWLAGDARDGELQDQVHQVSAVRHISCRVEDLTTMTVDEAWRPLLDLVIGWRLLAAVAQRQGRDPARPARARKVGNPLPE